MLGKIGKKQVKNEETIIFVLKAAKKRNKQNTLGHEILLTDSEIKSVR